MMLTNDDINANKQFHDLDSCTQRKQDFLSKLAVSRENGASMLSKTWEHEHVTWAIGEKIIVFSDFF